MTFFLKNFNILYMTFFALPHDVHLKQLFTWTVVLKVRRPPNPTVLCIIWTCMHPWVTTCVPVLKTTRFLYSNRRCCHIRVFHPYLAARSPRLIILWHGPRGGFGHALPTLHGHVTEGWQDMFTCWHCSLTGLLSLHLSEVLLFICVPHGLNTYYRLSVQIWSILSQKIQQVYKGITLGFSNLDSIYPCFCV